MLFPLLEHVSNTFARKNPADLSVFNVNDASYRKLYIKFCTMSMFGDPAITYCVHGPHCLVIIYLVACNPAGLHTS